VFVGLNPSTADANTDDPTIRRMVGFARQHCAGWLLVVNLFAFVATKPRTLRDELKMGIDVVGPENDAYLRDALWHPDALAVAAWGAIHHTLRWRVDEVARLAPPLLCLGTTKAGHPRHPLYLRSGTPLVPYAT
jgi:hypothetical protein